MKSESVINNMIKEKKQITKDSVMKFIGDQDMRAIFSAVRSRPMFIWEIVGISRLPSTTAYRKIAWMIGEGLIHADIGKKRYRRFVTKIYPSIEDLTVRPFENYVYVKMFGERDGRVL